MMLIWASDDAQGTQMLVGTMENLQSMHKTCITPSATPDLSPLGTGGQGGSFCLCLAPITSAGLAPALTTTTFMPPLNNV